MKLVIDIDEEIYKDIMIHNREMREGGKSAYYFEELIQNGKPLPKGHGRIIDENKINKVYVYTDEAIANNIKAISTIITGTDAPTIIEAESEENKMPHSLRTKLKHLAHKCELTEKECERLVKALDTVDAVEEIKAECIRAVDRIPITFSKQDADNCLKKDIRDIFDKHIGKGQK